MMLKMYLPARASRLLLMTSRGEVPQRTPSCPNVDERDHPRACLQWRLDTCDKMFSEASLTRLYFDVLKTGMIGTPDGHELARPTSGIDPAYLQAAQAARQNVKRRRVPRIRSYSPRVFLFLRSPARAWFCGLLLTNRHDGRAVTGVLCTGVVQRRNAHFSCASAHCLMGRCTACGVGRLLRTLDLELDESETAGTMIFRHDGVPKSTPRGATETTVTT